MDNIGTKLTYGGVRRFLRPGMTHSLPAFIQRLQGSSDDLNSHRTCKVSECQYHSVVQGVDGILLSNLYTLRKPQFCEINMHQ